MNRRERKYFDFALRVHGIDPATVKITDRVQDTMTVECDPRYNRLVATCLMLAMEAAQRDRIADFNCFDCKLETDMYMVRDDVWAQAWPTAERDSHGRQLLCLLCLHDRLGRPLRMADFTDAPINNAIRYAYRMGRST